MSIHIRDTTCKKKSKSCMEELKYLIHAIDNWYVKFNLGNLNESQLSKFSRVGEKCLIINS